MDQKVFAAARLMPTYLEVKKVDGTRRYYKVADEESVEITEQEYTEAHKCTPQTS